MAKFTKTSDLSFFDDDRDVDGLIGPWVVRVRLAAADAPVFASVAHPFLPISVSCVLKTPEEKPRNGVLEPLIEMRNASSVMTTVYIDDVDMYVERVREAKRFAEVMRSQVTYYASVDAIRPSDVDDIIEALSGIDIQEPVVNERGIRL